MSFAYPLVLLLIIPMIILHFFIWKRPLPSLKVSSLKLFQNNTTKPKTPKSLVVFILYFIVSVMIIVALARPRVGKSNKIIKGKGIDIMLAIDLSGSMKAMDVSENIRSESQLERAIASGKIKNRLEVAKDEITKFIKNRPNDRIGLIAFAPLPYVACPPTLDHSWLFANLKTLQPGIIGDATGIAGPIASAVKRLKDSKLKRKVLVLFTDGANTVDAKISPIQAAQIAKDFDVIIYCVGIGSKNAYAKQQSFFGTSFSPVSKSFDEKLLKDISKITKGKYYKAKDAKTLQQAMESINKLEKTVMKQPKFLEYTEYTPTLLKYIISLLIITFILEHTLFIRIP